MWLRAQEDVEFDMNFDRYTSAAVCNLSCESVLGTLAAHFSAGAKWDQKGGVGGRSYYIWRNSQEFDGLR